MNEVVTTLASRWKRLSGFMIDCIIGIAIVIPIALATGTLQQAISGEQMTIGQKVGAFVVGSLVFLLVNGYLLLKKGQTIGKYLVKTRIVDLSGNIPNFGKVVVLRYLIFWAIAEIPIIGNLVGLDPFFIFGKQRRCLHDYIAGTRVIDA